MITTYQANRILNYIFGYTHYNQPTKYYVGLSTTNIGADGTNVTEPNAAEYKRLEISNDKYDFSVATTGELTNNKELRYNESLNGWGVVRDIFIADSEKGGNVLYYEKLETPRDIIGGYTVVFPKDSISISLGACGQ